MPSGHVRPIVRVPALHPERPLIPGGKRIYIARRKADMVNTFGVEHAHLRSLLLIHEGPDQLQATLPTHGCRSRRHGTFEHGRS
jgi:hypothetical protein